MIKADAILCSDIHIREDAPVCRLDNYLETLFNKIRFISDLQKEHDCPVFHAGDLFDHWKPSPYLLSKTIKFLPNKFFTVYGQHDLPQHSLELSYKCGIDTLKMANRIEILQEGSWGQSISKGIEIKGRKIAVWHNFVYQGQLPWPGCNSPSAKKLLRQFPQFDLILTGDNHKNFIEGHDKRLLVNPGSLMRMDTDQINHSPRVYLWYAEMNRVVPMFLPIEKNIISVEHLELVKNKNKRIQAFITKLNTEVGVGISFEKNLKIFINQNNIPDNIADVIYATLS